VQQIHKTVPTEAREQSIFSGNGEALASGKRKVRWQQKDVKLYGTNSVNSFTINKSAKKTNSNQGEIRQKNVLKMRKETQNEPYLWPPEGENMRVRSKFATTSID
jgi:hypothetical protein